MEDIESDYDYVRRNYESQQERVLSLEEIAEWYVDTIESQGSLTESQMQDLQIELENSLCSIGEFDRFERVGEGDEGLVDLVRDREGRAAFVVKYNTDEFGSNFENEIRVLRYMTENRIDAEDRHFPLLLGYVEDCDSESIKSTMAIEYLPFHMIACLRYTHFDSVDVDEFVLELLNLFIDLNDHGLRGHNDLHSGNILQDSVSGKLFAIDFGSSSIYGDGFGNLLDDLFTLLSDTYFEVLSNEAVIHSRFTTDVLGRSEPRVKVSNLVVVAKDILLSMLKYTNVTMESLISSMTGDAPILLGVKPPPRLIQITQAEMAQELHDIKQRHLARL